MSSLREFIQILSGLLTPLVAVIAVYIAWQQYRIQHYSLRNQLYERRYVVFKAFMSFLSEIIRQRKSDYQRVGQFYAEASEADFLFPESVAKKRDEIYEKAIDLIALNERMYPSDGSEGLPVGEERSAVAQKANELLKWFVREIPKTKELLKSEMKIGN